MNMIITNWQIARDPENRGQKKEWFAAVPKSAEAAPVPGVIQQVFPNYHGVAWYWARFSLPAAPGANERLLLRFGAVDYTVRVGCHCAGAHRGKPRRGARAQPDH
jgi:hypothetical protein